MVLDAPLQLSDPRKVLSDPRKVLPDTSDDGSNVRKPTDDWDAMPGSRTSDGAGRVTSQCSPAGWCLICFFLEHFQEKGSTCV